ncbi:MAG: hypothetical protein NXH94_19650 [Rhodobacteraceae bacterium]|uniref:hypothetical protein n=1 Tax=Marivita sp. TaxID=2003365 RepID=UPI003B5285B6|nr:hypothetical protein [Paracoccaceae bacterium]
MRSLAKYGRQSLAGLLCLSLVVWSVMPAVAHAPAVFETIQDHLEMIADHGHSHGLNEDLYWAMHGHSHDAADHDHSQALAALDDRSHPTSIHRDTWLLRASSSGCHHSFRIERPPRA